MQCVTEHQSVDGICAQASTPCEINLSFLFDPLAPYFNVDVKFHVGSDVDDHNRHEFHINIEIGG